MIPEPRDYQIPLLANIRSAFAASHRRVLLVSPTGSGKGFMIAYMASGAAQRGRRVYILVHRAELVEQLSESLRVMEVRHGRIQPGWPESGWPVQVGMIQTISRRLHKFASPDFIIVDESHHAVATTYQKVIDFWPGAKVVGFTATPMRLDGRGLGGTFDHMVVGPATRELIDAGWLADFEYLAPPSRVDLSSVAIRMGDYAIDQLAAATDKPKITGDVIDHYKTHLGGRPAIAFAVRVDHAEHIAEQARAAGIKAVSVDGKLDAHERRARIAGLGNGNTELLTSCDLVGEGLDIPAVSGALLLRRTKSLAMFLQWIGRTLRPKSDGSHAIILDHVGCIHEHGMPDAPRVWTLDDKKRSAKPAPTVTCEKCYRVFAGGPRWREGIECETEGEPGCALNVDDTVKEWTPPEQVDGELQRFTRSPDWAGGIDILLASGPEYHAMLARADTHAKVDEIRKARGYSARWTWHIMNSRRGRQAA